MNARIRIAEVSPVRWVSGCLPARTIECSSTVPGESGISARSRARSVRSAHHQAIAALDRNRTTGAAQPGDEFA
ncbi:hypothetical protein [Pseudonocardia sp.]|jgi:hypothetical protein|uniref:hypothetical protein n=1 Tax=Pseudonocardia sp. TaxID=60912 RepID=UPI0031FC5AC2